MRSMTVAIIIRLSSQYGYTDESFGSSLLSESELPMTYVVGCYSPSISIGLACTSLRQPWLSEKFVYTTLAKIHF